jgi:hypothetical protein
VVVVVRVAGGVIKKRTGEVFESLKAVATGQHGHASASEGGAATRPTATLAEAVAERARARQARVAEAAAALDDERGHLDHWWMYGNAEDGGLARILEKTGALVATGDRELVC